MPEFRLVPIGSVHESENDAAAAARALWHEGFEEGDISVITPSMIRPDKPWLLEPGTYEGADTTVALALLIDDVHDSAEVPDGHARRYAENIQRGRSLVLVTPPFGKAARAEALLAGHDPVDVGPLPELQWHTWLQPAPLSALLGLPVLSHGRSRVARLFGDPLTSPDFLPGRFFGRLLSDDPTPLSSKIGMRVLSDDPTPLSSRLGLPVLAKERPANKRTSFGLPLLTSERPANKRTSFGLPLLSRDPTPLSSLLGLPVLTRDQGGKASVG